MFSGFIGGIKLSSDTDVSDLILSFFLFLIVAASNLINTVWLLTQNPCIKKSSCITKVGSVAQSLDGYYGENI